MLCPSTVGCVPGSMLKLSRFGGVNFYCTINPTPFLLHLRTNLNEVKELRAGAGWAGPQELEVYPTIEDAEAGEAAKNFFSK